MSGTGAKFSLFLLFTLSLFLVSQCYHVPVLELQKCQVKCLEKDYNTTEVQICVMQCHQRYLQRGGGNGGSGGVDTHNPRVSPEQECKQLREGEGGREHGGEGNVAKKKEEENPYFFRGQRFQSRFKTDAGHFRVLQRFSEKSELLFGIDNYRLAIFEANPRTLLLPHHCDADKVFVVNNGQAIINIVQQRRRDSFDLQKGDAIIVPSGSTVYLINHDNNEKLQILMFVHPVNTPGHFEEFFGAGGEQENSFFGVFSKGLRRAAFNLEDKHEGFFEKQEKGSVIELSQEQVEALIRDQKGGSSSQGRWGDSSSQGQGGESGSSSQEQGDESRGPFNVLQQPPRFANELGQFFLESPDTNEKLRPLDVAVSFMNIKQGAMIEPYHNTRSTIVVVPVRGKGSYEMACPHVGKSSKDSKEKKHEDERSVQYKKVSAHFSEGDVFVIPPAHPISIVASEGEDVQFFAFGVNARNNRKHFHAGSDNIWNQVPSVLKAIAFSSETRETEEVFGSQQRAYFVPGPKQSEQTEKEKGQFVASIIEVLGLV